MINFEFFSRLQWLQVKFTRFKSWCKVQERNDQRLEISDLIFVDFERWMTLFIQANFEKEYRGLQKVILHMSISNSDKIESFSKKISWRLFSQYEIREHVEYAISNIQLPRHLNRKESQSYRDTLFHTFSAGKQICSPQNDHHRRVSFVLPTDARSDSPQYFEDPAHKSAEKARRQTDEHLLSYRKRPRQYKLCWSGRWATLKEIWQIWLRKWWGWLSHRLPYSLLAFLFTTGTLLLTAQSTLAPIHDACFYGICCHGTCSHGAVFHDTCLE